MSTLNNIDKIKTLKPALLDLFGIEKIAVFGSVARDEANETVMWKSNMMLDIIKKKLRSWLW
ncbi:MAG: hypothetical protein WC667_02490 [Sulfurimonas sp.]|jgi:predicted nucleotidyltransferase